MTLRSVLFVAVVTAIAALPFPARAFSDVTPKTFEYAEINQVIADGWLVPQASTTFGYGVALMPDEWFRMLMFLRTEDACPELGSRPTAYWTPENIRGCLAGAGVPTATERADRVRRDEAMQQLFALRRRSFAFKELETKPSGYVEPSDLESLPANRQGALVAADRLKLLFRTRGAILPASPLLREDGALAVRRLLAWEAQGGVEAETSQQAVLTPEAKLHRWRDLETDVYVIELKTGGDTVVRPILPRRSFTPARPGADLSKIRDEFVYQPVSALAQESGALAAINGSYFNVDWPWGSLEDVAMIDGKTYFARDDRSTFVVCADQSMYIWRYDLKALRALKCTPQHALGAGPLFLSNGTVLDQSTKEGFDEFTLWERRVGKNARTAIGISADRKTAYLIVVAGKSYPAFGQGGSSLGAFLKEKYPDMHEAMMFDGGGSTTLYAQGKTQVAAGTSGGASERAVISALGLFSKKAEQIAAQAFKKEAMKRWDAGVVKVKAPRPTVPFAWTPVMEANLPGVGVTRSGTRGARIDLALRGFATGTHSLTFDRLAYDATTTKLLLARREGTHSSGWRIPTELHVIDPKTGTDTDLIRLFAYMPAAQRPDLKTFDVLQFGRTGILLGDGTGRAWFYYARDRQLSPAMFVGAAASKAR